MQGFEGFLLEKWSKNGDSFFRQSDGWALGDGGAFHHKC